MGLKSELLITQLKLSFIVKKGGKLPDFTGSMIRGIFGRALKKSFCIVSHGECVKCPLTKSCGYFELFQTESPQSAKQGFHFKPHPYLFYNLPKEKIVNEGELIYIGFSLFGDQDKHIAYLLHAFRFMGMLGFGKDNVELELEDIKIVRPDLNAEFSFDRTDVDLSFPISQVDRADNIQLKKPVLRFLTPCRIQKNGRDLYRLQAEDLLRAIKIRYKLIFREYGTFIDSDLNDISNILIRTIDTKLRNIQRYSSRQDRKHNLPGIIGDIELLNPTEKLLALLKRISYINLGKSTTFGLGKFELVDAEDTL